MHRFPVLVWEDFSGSYTGRVVDDEEDPGVQLAAVGSSVRVSPANAVSLSVAGSIGRM